MRTVIVGGVAAGMSCATRLRRRDPRAEIIVLERGDFVSFANCGLPYFVGGEIADAASLVLQTPETLQEGHNLDVRVRAEAIGLVPEAQTVTVLGQDGEYALHYDELVLAPGAAALVPPIPGIHSPRVHTVRSVNDAVGLAKSVREGSRAIVIGGGFIGLETAEGLAKRGVTVAVIELAPHVLPPIDDELAPLVRGALEQEGIAVVEGVGVAAIEDGADEALVLLSDGSKVGVDLVVLSAGVRPDTAVFEKAGLACERGAIIVDEHGRTNLDHVWAAGDAILSVDAVTGARRPVALAGPANRAGRLVADAIVDIDSARPIPHPLGTAIVRVGDSRVAMTGANRRALDAAGIAFQSIHLHPANHATYFPGAEGMSIVAHIDSGTGRLLGAQAFGGDGVDKRIDVLATAIRDKKVAADLIDLDLAYSPPFGAAKDPVNLLGMIADNIHSGELVLWYAQDVDVVIRTSLVIDARSATEYATGHIPGAINIPFSEIHERIGEVRGIAQGRPVRVYCASGYRSYLAHRVLSDSGIDSASLSGGVQTLRAVLGPRATTFLITGD